MRDAAISIGIEQEVEPLGSHRYTTGSSEIGLRQPVSGKPTSSRVPRGYYVAAKLYCGRPPQLSLAHEGTDWRGLVESCRCREAIRLLTESDIQLIELAHRIGYTDQANFGRAFRKWTGMSPRTYRKLRLQ